MLTPRRESLPLLIWIIAIVSFIVLWLYGKPVAGWAFKIPRDWRLPIRSWIGESMTWLVEQASFGLFTFNELTRFIATLIEIPYRIVLSLLATGFLQGQGSDAVQILPPLSWLAVTGLMALVGFYSGGRKLGLLVGGCFLFLAVFGQWENAMITLSSILVAVPLGVSGGLLLGIAAYRWHWVDKLLKPLLDLMQTIPVFAYLVPVLFLFGFGPTAAIIATIIYALPPMTRITRLALCNVPADLLDLSTMTGCNRLQTMWKVMIPTAMPGLMVGVNQVIMLSLNMVIIASMIGAGGLGYEVLAALRRLDIGTGMEAGFAIVALAIALDRLSQAFALKTRSYTGAPAQSDFRLVRRYPYLLTSVALIILTAISGIAAAPVQTYPELWQLSTGNFWSELVAWININYFDTLEAFKNALLLNVLIPFKRFLLSLPWFGVMLLLTLLGWTLAGWRMALMVGSLSYLIAATGLWNKAMVTVYLCGIAVLIASLIGIPIAIVSAERKRLWRFIEAIIDTLQTLPSFVYLMPAVMLFRVGDFTAMIAVVAYAIAPAIRYTAYGIRQVNPELIEAGLAMGCTPWQQLTKIKLKLAWPAIMLGINQTIMLALSMLVITALVGTRDLGQEVYIALTKADTGRGLEAGLVIAFIAIIADRLIAAYAARQRQRLGLT